MKYQCQMIIILVTYTREFNTTIINSLLKIWTLLTGIYILYYLSSWLRLSLEGKESDKFLIKDKSIFKIGSTSTYICKRNTQVVNVTGK